MSSSSLSSSRSAHEVQQRWDTLYAVDKNGKTKLWLAMAERQPDDTAICILIFGQEDGKLQETRRVYSTGKNIGRKNETSAWQQCLLETERKWRDKVEKEGYQPRTDDKNEEKTEEENRSPLPPTPPFYPMLAHPFDPVANAKKRHAITFPCFTQPKIDGLRCLMYYCTTLGVVVAQSRTGGRFHSVRHLTDAVCDWLKHHPDWVLDGELYTRNYPFEELAGLLKKSKRSDADENKLRHVQYHLYDAVNRADLSLPFVTRWEWLEKSFASFSSSLEKREMLQMLQMLVLVETKVTQDLGDFRRAFATYVADGWEGVMLRNARGVYTPNYRSNDLVKYKEFMEQEFTIVGWKEGEGRDEGTVIWECQTQDGSTFSVRPRGTLEMRRAWFNEAASYVGKPLTVIFQEWSEKGVPRFPVGKAIREAY